MSEQPPSKGLKPVASAKMLNFVYWLATNYPDMCNVQYLENNTLLQLAEAFEQDRPDLESDAETSWRSSVNKMLQGNEDYREAREVLERNS